MTLLIAILAGFASLSGGPGLDNRCTIAHMAEDYLRQPADTRVVARLVDKVTVPRADRRNPFFAANDKGWRIRIESGDGVGFGGVASPGSEVLVFAWGVNADCTRHTVDIRVAADSLHHFTMRLRPDSLWVDGRPTFDVGLRGWRVYPNQPTSWPYPPPSVDQFAHMLSLMPDSTEWAADCRPGINRVLKWHDDHERPFPQIIPPLLGRCEERVREKARSFARRGVDRLPPDLERWAAAQGCRVSMGQAVRGRFTPASRRQWAIACETNSEWRLLIVDTGKADPLAVLSWMRGSAANWSIAVVEPTYFQWATFWPADEDAGLRTPAHDVVLLDGSTVFYFNGTDWTAGVASCCVVRD